MLIHEVQSAVDISKFLYLPHKIYTNFPNYVHPLRVDIESVFNSSQNKTFGHGICKRWILETVQGDVIGRIAAFIDFEQSKRERQPTGGIGFFECINDQAAANLLFETGQNFLSQQGMQAMDGPINFGNRSTWWGLLVKGFDILPAFQMNYNPPYYKDLFENYGFQTYFEQYCFQLGRQLPERISRMALRVLHNPDYECRSIDLKQLDMFAADFLTIYNSAWENHGVEKLELNDIKENLKMMKFIMDPDLTWFAYHKGQPVSFFIVLPDLNCILHRLKGDFNWFTKLQILYYKTFHPITRMCGTVFGTTPEFQNKGIQLALVECLHRAVKTKPYQIFEDETGSVILIDGWSLLLKVSVKSKPKPI